MKKRSRTSAAPISQGHSRVWFWHLTRCVALLLMVYLVYSNSFQSGWVLDNRPIVQLDPRNKEASIENLKLIWSKDYWWPKSDSGAYRPLVSTSYWLNWSVLGNGRHAKESDQVVGFHWVNLIAHGINAILVYLLLTKLLHRHGAPFFAAALFAVHPVATESVTNIIGRADLFMAMSFLAGALLYIRSTEAEGLRRLPWLFGVLVVHSAGLLSKESSIAFLAVPLLFDSIYRWGSEQYRDRRARRILLDWLYYIVLMLPLAAVLFVRSVIFRDAPVPPVVFLDNPILRLRWNEAAGLSENIGNWILARMTACNAAAKALWKLIWPAHLSSDYSYNQIPLFEWDLSHVENIKAILAMMFIAATLVVAAWCYKRYRVVSFFILFYWIAYGPTSNFVLNASSIMGERFLYIPLVAFCALVILGVEGLARRAGLPLSLDRDSIRRPWPRLVPHAALVVVLVLCSIRTYNRNFDWRSDLTLAKAALEVSPRSFRPYQTLAFAYYLLDPTGRIDQIIELAENGLKILDPLSAEENTSRPYLDLGIYYGVKGEFAATRNADGSLSMNDSTRGWYRKSAQILERGSEIDLAANASNRSRQLERGRTNIPDVGLPALYMYLGMAYAGLEMDDKALQAFKYMRHLEPTEPEAYTRIASAQLAGGQFEDAAVALLQCIVIAPQRDDAWQSLAQIYSQLNRESVPAVEVIENRPRLREDNKLVRQHLARAYRELISIARSSERPDMLRNMRELADRQELLDDAPDVKVDRPVPPSPAF
jgi:hypothetical protein